SLSVAPRSFALRLRGIVDLRRARDRRRGPLVGPWNLSGAVVRHGDVVREQVERPTAGRAGPGTPRDHAGELEGVYLSRWLRTVRVAHAIVGSASAAEDLAQEAFVRVHDHWSALETPDAFLRTALVNLCRSALRRSRLERSKHTTTTAPALP